MAWRRAFAAGLLVSIIAIAGFLALAHAPALPATEPGAHAAFAPAQVERGRQLAALGDCIVCHTAPGGRAYAGGRALETPFGVIHGSNITPDPQSGIGAWSEAAFVRAMREGLDREGRHLYPAFPYDHFRLISDEDLRALYAFVITREPVEARPPPNRLRFPFNLRPLIAVWKALYLDRGEVPRDGARDLAWQRGGYLVHGIAHCGACHTPRNRLGAEVVARAFEGGEAEGWDAPALGASSPAPSPWSADELHVYLRGGQLARHGVAGGPMTPVVNDLAQAADADVQAIAAYVSALGEPDAGRRAAIPAIEAPAGSPEDSGRAIYQGACASCHERDRNVPGGALALSQSTLVFMPAPRNLFRVILHGLAPADGQRGPWMPGFDGMLTEPQAEDLARYLRARVGAPPWRDLSASLREVMRTPDERAVSEGP